MNSGLLFWDNYTLLNMAVKIRISLVGKTHQISYRLVAQDSRSKRDGKFLEILGFFNPSLKENRSKFKKDRVKYYLEKGATFTPSAKHLFEKGELPPRPKKIRVKKESSQQAQEVSPPQAKDAPEQTEAPVEETQNPTPQTEPSVQTIAEPEAEVPTEPKPAETNNEPEKTVSAQSEQSKPEEPKENIT